MARHRDAVPKSGVVGAGPDIPALYEKCKGAMYRVARSMLRGHDEHRAEDAVQEAVISLWRKPPTDVENWEAIFVQAVKWKVYDMLKSSVRMHEHLVLDEGTPLDAEHGPDDLALDPAVAAAEIARVRAAWGDVDLCPHDVRVEREAEVPVSAVVFRARLVSHGVPGGTELGVILVPKGARPGTLPVLVEAKGVSWNFFPLRVPEGLNLPRILGADVGKFILVVPGFRGEEVRLGEESFCSPSRHESWSGAAEDLLALLNVALETTPEADPARIGVFGRSRGGSVALLAAERDPRIRCVVSWAAPADWFRLMAPEGWTQREVTADALQRGAKRDERGGQFLFNFLRFAREGTEDLDAVRARLLASSPLYFVESVPPAQLHYGVEDAIVPERNGRAIERRLRNLTGAAGHVEIVFHAGAGHDQDLFEAPRRTREFLLERLLGIRPKPPVP